MQAVIVNTVRTEKEKKKRKRKKEKTPQEGTG